MVSVDEYKIRAHTRKHICTFGCVIGECCSSFCGEYDHVARGMWIDRSHCGAVVFGIGKEKVCQMPLSDTHFHNGTDIRFFAERLDDAVPEAVHIYVSEVRDSMGS